MKTWRTARMIAPDTRRTRRSGRWMLLAAICCGALMLADTAAACQWGWRASGGWKINQDNNVQVTVSLEQDRDLLTGYGEFYGPVVDPAQKNVPGSTGFRNYTGQIDAIITGDTIEMRIFWMPGMVGVYQGRIDRGRAVGEHWDRDRPGQRIGWRSSRLFACIPPPSSPN
ncbi:MAG: hypothetical protein NW200_12425 [Hyphomonadaceae bacterium]|nr:hypothetical protein [Hyphomonadaceae bacterium]